MSVCSGISLHKLRNITITCRQSVNCEVNIQISAVSQEPLVQSDQQLCFPCLDRLMFILLLVSVAVCDRAGWKHSTSLLYLWDYP